MCDIGPTGPLGCLDKKFTDKLGWNPSEKYKVNDIVYCGDYNDKIRYGKGSFVCIKNNSNKYLDDERYWRKISVEEMINRKKED
ncbi:hypothetical protein ACFO6R_12780 [Eubacterium multiforme]|uniref:Uncharacterized protein n=1 Tax=Eubacterium multiforme TaxID=83339 RepID=A0ABT9UW49_9FIRM|nr:hypothetical protein [Eubacterium multiforme]MDQ0150556.1 hypothetical protein [Eubacterium multiforme]